MSHGAPWSSTPIERFPRSRDRFTLNLAVRHPIMSQTPPIALTRHIRPLLSLWHATNLVSRTRVRLSGRLTRSLATCTPERYEIRLRTDVPSFSAAKQREILAHELAHIVAWHENPDAPPHGHRWRELVRQAGYAPKLQIDPPPGARSRASGPRYVYIHTCPVCHFRRIGRRPVRQWRCRSCTDAGLDGKLLITRRRAPNPNRTD